MQNRDRNKSLGPASRPEIQTADVESTHNKVPLRVICGLFMPVLICLPGGISHKRRLGICRATPLGLGEAGHPFRQLPRLRNINIGLVLKALQRPVRIRGEKNGYRLFPATAEDFLSDFLFLFFFYLYSIDRFTKKLSKRSLKIWEII